VGAHLCGNLNSVEHTMTCWREGVHEVGYVVSRGRDIWAIEVESSRSGKAAGLTRFRKRYPKAKALLAGMQGVNLEEFVSNPVRTWLV
jgi:L-rhamnose isomerase